MTSLAVLSDIHGNLIALEAVLADLEAQGGVDHIWVLGDLAAFGSRPAECIRRVQALLHMTPAPEPPHDHAPPAGTPPRPEHAPPGGHPPHDPRYRAIRGNTDRYLVNGTRPREKGAENVEELSNLLRKTRERDISLAWGLDRLTYPDYEFLRKLGGECDLEVPGYGWVIGYHGTPGNDEGMLKPDSSEDEAADALLDREGRLGIGGHIHVQMDRTLRSGWRVINVGSVGMSFDQPGKAQWGLFTFADGDVTVDLRSVPYDVEAAIADGDAVGYPVPGWLASKLRPAG